MRGDWEELERRQGASLEGPGKFVALGVMAMVAFLAWTQFFGQVRRVWRDGDGGVPGVDAVFRQAARA